MMRKDAQSPEAASEPEKRGSPETPCHIALRSLTDATQVSDPPQWFIESLERGQAHGRH